MFLMCSLTMTVAYQSSDVLGINDRALCSRPGPAHHPALSSAAADTSCFEGVGDVVDIQDQSFY